MRVSKAVVVAVVVAFAATFAALAFLLGRESMRGRPAVVSVTAPVPPVEVAPAVAPAPAPLPPVEVVPAPVVAVASEPVAPPPPPVIASAPTPTPTATAVAPPTAVSSEAAAVQTYFRRISSIQASGMAGDPNEVANRMLSSAMSGDASGFDELIRSAEDGESKARALDVPAPCADYQRDTLALLHDGVALTRSLKSALQRQDTTALESLAASANGMRSRAESLEAEEKAVKARYGIAP